MSTPPSPQEATNSFETLLTQQVGYWQEVLRLQDWNLEVRLARAHEMEGDNQPIAQTRIYPHRKDAILRFLHPMDIASVEHKFLNGEAKDYDVNIVHELLHLHFEPFARPLSTHQGFSQEQAIETLSRAFVRLHRQGATETPGGSLMNASTEANNVQHGHYV